ncbi:MAG: hypothetical protein DRI73_11445, partial [Bacteroidetes bacterium]
MLNRKVYKFFRLIIFILLLNNQGAFAQINIQHYINQGQRSLFRNDNSDAIRKFNLVIKINPELFQPYFFRGLAKYNLGDYIGARSDFSKAISLHPYFTHAYHYRGITEERLNNYHSAMENYNSALEIDPVNPDIYSSRGFTRMLMNDTTGALQDFNEAILLNSNNYQAFLNRSLIWSMKKEFDKALEDCSKAISINKYNIEAFFRRGIIWYYKGDMDKAITDFDFMIKVDSTNSRAYYYRALARYKKEDLPGAMEDYDKVLELDPLNALTFYNRAILKTQIGDNQGAIDDYGRVIELNPNNIFTYFNRAGIKLDIGDYYGAINDLSRVIEIYPGFTQAFQNRAVAKSKLNDYAGAMEDQAMAEKVAQDTLLQSRIAKIDSNYFNKIIELKANFDFGNFSDESLASLNASVKMKPVFIISFTNKLTKKFEYSDLRNINKYSSGDLYLDMLPMDKLEEINDISIETIKKTFKYKSGSFRELFLSGTVFGYQKDFNKAFDLFDQALRKSPDNYLVYFNMAGLKYKLIELLNSIDRKDDFLVVEDRQKGTTRTLEQNQKDYKEIIRLYDRVLVLNPQFSLAYFNRAYIKSLTNNLSGAISDYQQAVSLDPDLAVAFFNRGLIYIYMDDMDHGC